MKIAIVKYNAGNVQSVTFALQRIGIAPILTDDVAELQSADKVIFPGVGEAGTAMKYLKERKLDVVLKSLEQPFLGICLGMQLMCQHSEEANTECLGIFSTNVKKFPPELKVPHMGWNTISNLKTDLYAGVENESSVYFVHSFYAETCAQTIANCDYIFDFSAALNFQNFYGVQFHPEKSGLLGAKILENFIQKIN
jgi:imidazole glycerol-phosphate synthase subunit HisH